MAWVLDGIFTHGAPLTINKILIVRDWGDRGYYLLHLGLTNDAYVYDRLYAKWRQKFEYDKVHLYEWRNPGDPDYTSVVKPKDLLLTKAWFPTLQPRTNTYNGPVLGVAFDKTAMNQQAISVLTGRGYEHVGYGGNMGL